MILREAHAKLRRGTELALGKPGATLTSAECDALVGEAAALTESALFHAGENEALREEAAAKDEQIAALREALHALVILAEKYPELLGFPVAIARARGALAGVVPASEADASIGRSERSSERDQPAEVSLSQEWARHYPAQPAE